MDINPTGAQGIPPQGSMQESAEPCRYWLFIPENPEIEFYEGDEIFLPLPENLFKELDKNYHEKDILLFCRPVPSESAGLLGWGNPLRFYLESDDLGIKIKTIKSFFPPRQTPFIHSFKEFPRLSKYLLKNARPVLSMIGEKEAKNIKKEFDQDPKTLGLLPEPVYFVPASSENPTDDKHQEPDRPWRHPGISADLADGSPESDLLNIRKDVRQMAQILASKAVAPPLAFGLFGHWGSGKSFFFQQVIREIESIQQKVVREKKRLMDGNTGATEPIQFYEDIVQIEFNAWHYSESDLWASLVDHLFTELRCWLKRRDPDESEMELELLLAELNTTLDERNQAIELQKNLEKEIKLKTQLRNQKQADLEKTGEKLAQEKARDLWLQVSLDKLETETKAALKSEANSLGFSAAVKDVQPLLKSAQDVQGLWGRSLAIFKSLQQQGLTPWNIQCLVLVLLIAIGVGPLLTWLAALMEIEMPEFTDTLSQVVAFIAGIKVWMGPILKWLNKHLEKVNGFLDTVEEAGNQVQKMLREEETKRNQEVALLENELTFLREQMEQAERSQQDARDRLKELQTAYLNQRPESRLTRFIEERANSDDYRKKLGVLALVRRDFERLSKLLTLRRSYLENRTDQEVRAKLKEALAETDGPQEDNHIDQWIARTPSIDRIILYIDDLDRCSQKKVVEVLQAVHLLLAYDLFIVVVAVDPRWVSASLEHEHPQLYLYTSPDGSPRGNGNSQPVIATQTATRAIDYLEKIFQIPFWVPPFDNRQKQILVNKLLEDQVTPGAAASSGSGDGTDDQSGSQPSREAHAAANQGTGEGQGVGPETGENQGNAPGSSVEETTLPHSDTPFNLNPESLQLTAEELEALKNTAWLAGQTPRQIKRFTNLYRLFKSGMDKDLPRLHEEMDGVYGYEATATLLALVTGFPNHTGNLFRLLKNYPKNKTLWELSKDIFLGICDNKLQPIPMHRWTENNWTDHPLGPDVEILKSNPGIILRVSHLYHQPENSLVRRLKIGRLIPYIPDAARFSFEGRHETREMIAPGE